MEDHNHDPIMLDLNAAAVLYTPTTVEPSILSSFAESLKADGVRVGGIVQERLFDAMGHKLGVDAIEIDTGRRIPINRPTESDRINLTCSLDHSALADATEAIRRAIAERVDLIVIEKFGDQEKVGGGLSDEILTAMAEGIPTLTLVPALSLEEWNVFCGGMSDLLPCSQDDLWRWWKARATNT